MQRELFDSNGFVHCRQDAPRWNPHYKVFADYYYFLQCLKVWKPEGFKLNPLVLVDYVQTSDGVIGQSSYGDWSGELESILNNADIAQIFTTEEVEELHQQAKAWRKKHSQSEAIAAFACSSDLHQCSKRMLG